VGVGVGSGFKCGKGLYVSCTDGGRIDIGCNVCIGRNVKLVAQSGVIKIGDNAFIGDGSIIVAKKDITIGNDALIAEYVVIRDQDHGLTIRPIRKAGFKVLPVIIENNVWVGAKSTILKGVNIGSDSVFAAHALVNRDVGARSIVAGVPAKKSGCVINNLAWAMC
jgi:acetyltransferase-like isoleucine patch superfamily enzyme